jgi:transposase
MSDGCKLWSSNMRRRSFKARLCGLYVLGIDVGKNVFHLVGLDQRGQVIVRKKLSRTQLLAYTANRSVDMIGMEACAGSHFLARTLVAQGHNARLMPAQYVRPYVKSNKNDFVDAEAIAEAVQRPTMRFVPIKTNDQLDVQALHRLRERWIGRRTAVINQIRCLLLERGFTVPQGPTHLRERLPGILENEDGRLSRIVITLIRELCGEWLELEGRIDRTDEQISLFARDNDACQRLQTIPGIGIVTATALMAAIGNGKAFRKGRDLAAWLGLVPKQHSTGGRPKLLSISKRGNPYLRQLFVHGARSVFACLKRDRHQFGRWLDQLQARKRPSVSIVALANKLARIAWAVLTTSQPYRATA